MNILALLDQPRTYAELAEQIPPNQLDTRLAALKRQRRIVRTVVLGKPAWMRLVAIPDVPTRRCYRCHEDKPATDFDYRKRYCRPCVASIPDQNEKRRAKKTEFRCMGCHAVKPREDFKPQRRLCSECEVLKRSERTRRRMEREQLRYAKRSDYANRRLAELA